jgi:F-type H+-transporting ATPase subunit b
MGFLKDFGFEPILLIAQIVNFVILLLLLKRFLYKPVLGMLEKRRNQIAEGLKNAQEMEKKLAETKIEQERILSEAGKKAQAYIEEAKSAAEDFRVRSAAETKAQVEAMLHKAKEAIEMERGKMRAELREELVDLVVKMTSKVAGKTLTDQDHSRLSQAVLKEIK